MQKRGGEPVKEGYLQRGDKLHKRSFSRHIQGTEFSMVGA